MGAELSYGVRVSSRHAYRRPSSAPSEPGQDVRRTPGGDRAWHQSDEVQLSKSSESADQSMLAVGSWKSMVQLNDSPLSRQQSQFDESN
jgi:hypothetical protein